MARPVASASLRTPTPVTTILSPWVIEADATEVDRQAFFQIANRDVVDATQIVSLAYGTRDTVRRFRPFRAAGCELRCELVV
jgi:hypothetical protein